jgi:oxygen-independent coproporphyrinogen III oxidase
MKAGVYIHVPFCLTKCGYCNFFSLPFSQTSLNNYCSVLLKEIEQFKLKFELEPKTVYFGGGTPSLLSAGQIKAILDLLEPVEGAEITLEANPVQVTAAWVKALATTRVNRLSLGVQSLSEANLQALGRKHTAASVPERMRLLREAGFDNISLDLLYGLPHFSEQTFEAELEQYLALEPDHLSTYLLSIEETMPFCHWKGMLPDDKSCAAQYETICQTLDRAGWEHYEISNFTRPGQASRHNLTYWLDEPFAGLGAGASGFLHKQRYKRPEDLQLWQFSVERGDLLHAKEDETRAQQKADFIIMQLRLTRGLDLAAYKDIFGSDFVEDWHDVIAKFIASGHLERHNSFIRLTPQAWFVSNSVLREFV